MFLQQAFELQKREQKLAIRGKTSEMNGGLLSRGNPERRILETRQ
jgi:hypothetical protein